jgi:hypothetical protein
MVNTEALRISIQKTVEGREHAYQPVDDLLPNVIKLVEYAMKDATVLPQSILMKGTCPTWCRRRSPITASP